MPSWFLGGASLNYIDQEIRLETETPFGAEVPLAVSSALLRHLNETARPCVRMAIEGSSASAGAVPQWLERASDIRTLGFEKSNGRSVLHVKAPKLGDAAPDLFEQQLLWPGMASPEDTALQVMGKIGDVVRRHEEASDIYDKPLLKHLTHWRTLFRREVKEVHLPRAGEASIPAILDLTVVANAQQLSDQTPAPRQVRIAGKLDMVRHSTRSFEMLLEGEKPLRGVLQDADQMDRLKSLLGRPITIVGRAIYRPSGTVLRIDAQGVEAGAAASKLFSKVPPPLTRQVPSPRMRTGDQHKSWLDSFFGAWPGDETDQELLDMLREVRG